MLKSRKILAVVAGLALALGLLFLTLSKRRNSEPDFLTNRSEGYEHFAAAADEIAGRPSEITNGFANYVAMNKRAYDAIDRTFKESIEPPSSIYNMAAAGTNMQALMGFKKIGQALLTRSKAAEADGKISEAVDGCIDAIRFGQKVETGPLINLMVGSAIELMAIQRLEKLAPTLAETNLAHTIPQLLQLNQQRIAFSEVKRREEYFLAQNATNLIQVIRERFSPNTRKVIKNAEERYLSTAAHLEVLATYMAARQFEFSRKAAATSLNDLLSFMYSTPIDPYTKRKLQFKRSGSEMRVYSVGPNRADDGGKGDDIALGHQDTVGMKVLIDALSSSGK